MTSIGTGRASTVHPSGANGRSASSASQRPFIAGAEKLAQGHTCADSPITSIAGGRAGFLCSRNPKSLAGASIPAKSVARVRNTDVFDHGARPERHSIDLVVRSYAFYSGQRLRHAQFLWRKRALSI